MRIIWYFEFISVLAIRVSFSVLDTLLIHPIDYARIGILVDSFLFYSDLGFRYLYFLEY